MEMQKPCNTAKWRPHRPVTGSITGFKRNTPRVSNPLEAGIIDIRAALTGIRRRVAREMWLERLSHDDASELVAHFNSLISRHVKGKTNQGNQSQQLEGYLMTTMNKVTYVVNPATLTSHMVTSVCGHNVPLYTIRYLHFKEKHNPSINLMRNFKRRTTTTWHAYHTIATIRQIGYLPEVEKHLRDKVQYLPPAVIPQVQFISAGFHIDEQSGLVHVTNKPTTQEPTEKPKPPQTYHNVCPPPCLVIDEQRLILYDKKNQRLSPVEALEAIYHSKETGPLAKSVEHTDPHRRKWAAAHLLHQKYGHDKYGRYLDREYRNTWHKCYYDATGKYINKNTCTCTNRSPYPPKHNRINNTNTPLVTRIIEHWQQLTNAKASVNIDTKIRLAFVKYKLNHIKYQPKQNKEIKTDPTNKDTTQEHIPRRKNFMSSADFAKRVAEMMAWNTPETEKNWDSDTSNMEP